MKQNCRTIPLDLNGKTDLKLDNGVQLVFCKADLSTLSSGDLKLLNLGVPVIHRRGGVQLNVFLLGSDDTVYFVTVPREALKELASKLLSQYGIRFQERDKRSYGLKFLRDFVQTWTGSVMDDLGYDAYRYPESERKKHVSGSVVPVFSKTEFHSLNEKQLMALSNGNFLVFKRDPDAKVYIKDEEEIIWETILLNEDLPLLRFSLNEIGLEELS